MILCEAPPPSCENSTIAWFQSDAASGKTGVQVRTYGDYFLKPLPAADLPRCVNPIRICSNSLSFNLLAVWTWQTPSYKKAFLNGVNAYSDLLESGPVVITGDFNGNPKYDKPRQSVKWGDAFDRLDEYGLTSAYHHSRGVSYGAEPEPTHRLKRSQDPQKHVHIDYCFVPNEWINADTSVHIETTGTWATLSDHYPIIVDITPADSSNN